MPSFDVALIVGAIPSHITSGHRLWTLLSSGLLHLTQGHLLINVIILAFVGSLLERRVGSSHVLLLIVLGIMGGALAHVYTYPSSAVPLYGVSAGALALAGALTSTMLQTKAPPQMRLALKGGLLIAALALLAFNLTSAFQGGGLMPDALVESGVAHGVGLGIGLLYGVWINQVFPNRSVMPPREEI